MRLPGDADRDLTATAYIIRDGAVLLVRHAGQGVWLPPGGHIEDGETPDETAVREAREETGYLVEPVPEPAQPAGRSHELPRPAAVNLHPIETGHWHCDMAYRCQVTGQVDEIEGADEHQGMAWFGPDRLRDGDVPMPDNVRQTARRLLNDGHS